MTYRIMTGEAQAVELPAQPERIPDRPEVYIPTETAEAPAAGRASQRPARRRAGYGSTLVVRFFIAAALLAVIYFGRLWGSGLFGEYCAKAAELFG
ncbi:MAG: hypothetical protein IJT87_10230 [Ruminiclostridium sp.]|nr:hypothetical protein [Ruminiclostridium sp.]